MPPTDPCIRMVESVLGMGMRGGEELLVKGEIAVGLLFHGRPTGFPSKVREYSDTSSAG